MQKILFILFFYSSIYCFETVKNLNIERFMGKWYVIASIPNFVEKGCQNASDLYILNQDGTIDIYYYADKDGEPFTIQQKGIIIDNIHKSTWKIQFVDPWIPFYKAPYEVIILEEENYEYMVVGYPGNDLGWIMARTTIMDEQIYLNILDRLEENFNYNRNQFEKMIHNRRVSP